MSITNRAENRERVRIAVQTSLKCKNWWAQWRQQVNLWAQGPSESRDQRQRGKWRKRGELRKDTPSNVAARFGFWARLCWSEHLINFACWLAALIKTPFTTFLPAFESEWSWMLINLQRLSRKSAESTELSQARSHVYNMFDKHANKLPACTLVR